MWIVTTVLCACGGGNAGYPDAGAEISAPADGRGHAATEPAQQTLGRYAPAAAYVVLEGVAIGGGDLEYILGTSQRAFGGPLPVVGDFDGDGFDSVGRYGFVDNVFSLHNENRDGTPAFTFELGVLGSWPLAGDWNGDGVDTVGVCDLQTQRFTLFAENRADSASDEFVFGPASSIPVAGDFDGDGTDTVAMYEPNTATFHLRGAGPGGTDLSVKVDAPPGEVVPFAGDLDGDEIDDLATVETATATIRWQSVDGSARGTIQRPTQTLVWFAFTGHFEPTAPEVRREGYSWPTGSPGDHDVDDAALTRARDHANTLPHLHSMLIVRNGALLSESYYNDFRADMPQCIKSVSKSILSALYGIAFDRGELDAPTDTVASYRPDYLPSDADPHLLAIEFRHLLTMSAGLSWKENSFPTAATPSITHGATADSSSSSCPSST